jgi:hypothetical protein
MKLCVILITMALFLGSWCAWAGSVPEDDRDSQKIFRGDAKSFSKPAEIEFVALVKCTPEYKIIKAESLKSGAAKYWILMAKAQERVLKSITKIAREKKYDIVCEKGYLKKFDIEAKDITDLIEEDLTGESDDDKKDPKLDGANIEDIKKKLKKSLLEE